MRKATLQRTAGKLAALLLFAFWLVCPVQAQQAEWDALNKEGVLLFKQGNYEQATAIATQALRIAEISFGADHPNVATSLNSLAKIYKTLGKYTEAEPLYKRSLTIRERSFGPDHPNVAETLNNLATLYSAEGQYAQAEPLFVRSLAIREKSLGLDHLDVAETLYNFSGLYIAQRKYSQAEPLCRRSLAIRERAFGPDHPDVAESMNDVALLSEMQGQFAQAEPLFLRSLSIRETALGPNHPDVSESLINLGSLYQSQNKYAQAEPLYKRSLAIDENALGPDHPDVATTLSSLARLYLAQHLYAQALPLFQRSLAIREKALGPDHPAVAKSLNAIASIAHTAGMYDQAEALYKRSIAITEKAVGPYLLDFAAALNNLGALYHDQNLSGQAEQFYKRSLAIREKAVGPDHPEVANSLNNLGQFYSQRGDLAQAEVHLKRALTIHEKTFGSEHPSIAHSLNQLAALYYGQGQYAQALFAARRASAIYRQRIVTAGTDDSTVQEATLHQYNFSGHLSLLSRNSDNEPADKITDEAFQLVQLNQVSRTASDIAKMAARAAARDDTLAKKVREYQDAIMAWRQFDKQFIEAMGKNVSQRNPDLEKMLRKSLVDTEEHIKQIGIELHRDFPAYQELVNPEPMDVAKTQSLLKPDEALVTYLVNSEELLIWIIRPDQARMVRVDVTWDALSKRIAMLRRRVDLSLGVLPYYSKAEAYALYETIFAPVTQYLGGVKHVMVVADGPLQSLPFGLLVTSPVEAKSKAPVPWLVRQYAFSNLPSVSSLRALRRFEKAASAPEPFIGFGDPLLEGKSGLARNISMGKIFARGAVADVSEVRRLPRLPETANELKAMAKSMGSTGDNVWLRDAATERRAKTVDLSRFRVVAFATHGLISGEFPGLAQPALVLTPPVTPSESDDGLLTASEITGLKLNADWVILSACNTAAADGKPGAEGFSGLAKAFFYAGTKALLVSHWAVDSKNTVALTSRLFAETKGGASPAEALRRAMISLADNPRTSHPALWAPFVVVGEGWKTEAK